MQHHLVVGEETSKPGEPLVVHDPATGEDVGASPLTGGGRGMGACAAGCLYQWAERIEAEPENLAPLLSRENGRLRFESKVKLAAAVETVRFAAGQTCRLEGRSLAVGRFDRLARRYEP